MKTEERNYELTEETKINIFGVKLFIIRCTKAFKDIKVGDLGGWVSDNDRVFGNGWVYDNGQVFGNGEVYGDGWVYGNGRVYGDGKSC